MSGPELSGSSTGSAGEGSGVGVTSWMSFGCSLDPTSGEPVLVTPEEVSLVGTIFSSSFNSF